MLHAICHGTYKIKISANWKFDAPKMNHGQQLIDTEYWNQQTFNDTQYLQEYNKDIIISFHPLFKK